MWRTTGLETYFRRHRREGQILVLWGYFDESGKFADSDFVCLCGFLADEHWEPFCDEWRFTLARNKMPALHTAAINWKNQAETGALLEFVKIIRTHAIFGFGVAVDAGYFRAMPVEKRRLLGDKRATDFAFHRLLRLVRDKLHELQMDNWLSITFDYEDGFSQECLRSILRLRKEREYIRTLVRSIGFADDEMFYPLQAADLFAYGYKRFLQENPPDYWGAFAKPSTADDPGFPCWVSPYNAAELESACEQLKNGSDLP
jgi:hypothetical protein